MSAALFAAARPVLARLDPERAHRLTLAGLRLAGPLIRPPRSRPRLETMLLGRLLANPVGLAAGFDKDAEAVPGLLRLGFGFVEIGTVTPRPQSGNPRPRLFRLTEDRAAINRMGFNNAGVDAAASRLEAWRRQGGRGVVGANIGKNKDTPAEGAAADYEICARRLAPLADYLAVNVSSPNTPGLRALQAADALRPILAGVKAAAAKARPSPPVALKIAPDLDPLAAGEVARLVGAEGLADAVIVANTTIARPETLRDPNRTQAGGLSGAPVFARATALLGWMRQALGPQTPLIGVGGICAGADAVTKIRAGADAVQLYTALAWRGPALVTEILAALDAAPEAAGAAALTDLVGRDAAGWAAEFEQGPS